MSDRLWPSGQPPAPGLHLVHKPIGATSFAVVRAAIDALAGSRLPICHAGTLDPFASGLLVLAVGQATRAVHLLHEVPKEYEAVVAWGTETDNGDPGGQLVAASAAPFDSQHAEQALAAHVGWHDQVPPATCAKKIGGEPAYRKAHRGERVEMPAYRVFLAQARFLAHDFDLRRSRLFLRCGRGYYVRALVRDLGRELGCFAHLAALHRSAIGPWSDPAPDTTRHLIGRGLFPWLPARRLTDDEAKRVACGQSIDSNPATLPSWPMPDGFPVPIEPVLGIHADRLVALLRPSADQRLHPFTNLRGGL